MVIARWETGSWHDTILVARTFLCGEDRENATRLAPIFTNASARCLHSGLLPPSMPEKMEMVYLAVSELASRAKVSNDAH